MSGEGTHSLWCVFFFLGRALWSVCSFIQLAKCYRSLPCVDCVATIGNTISPPKLEVLVLKSKISISIPRNLIPKVANGFMK